MGCIHQLPEQCHIICLQGFHRPNGTLILTDGMLCPFSAHITLDGRLVFFKGLLIQISKAVNLHHLLQLCKGRLALTAAFIVFGVAQPSLFVAAGNDDFGAFQHNGRIFKGQICRVQENGIVLFPHGNGKLIHNAAVYTVKIIFRILSD